MSALAGHLDDYLALRRSLGHKLDDAARLLPRFVAYLDASGAKTVSVAAALAWAQEPQAGPGSCVRAHRMTAARGFARYLAGTDPATEVPPLGLVTYRPQRHAPYLYTDHMHLRRMAGDEIGAQGCLRLRPLRFILEEPPGRGHRPFLALGQGRTQTGAGTEG